MITWSFHKKDKISEIVGGACELEVSNMIKKILQKESFIFAT